MSADTYYTEVTRKIYGKSSGEFIAVSPDEDGLGTILIKIDDKECQFRVCIPNESAGLVAAAIIECAKEIRAQEAIK